MKAYEIIKELEELLEAEIMEDGTFVIPSTGEVVTKEELTERVKEMQVAKKEKLNNCCGFIANVNGDNETIDSEIKRLQALKKANDNKVKFVKTVIIPMLTEGEKWKSETHSVSYRTNTSTEPLVEAEKLPDEYRKTTYEPRLSKLKEALLKGVEGVKELARLVESKSTIVK